MHAQWLAAALRSTAWHAHTTQTLKHCSMPRSSKLHFFMQTFLHSRDPQHAKTIRNMRWCRCPK